MKNKIIALLIILLSLTMFNTYAENKIAMNELSSLKVNERQISIPSYKIDGDLYFKLRDVANILNFTDKKINIIWDKQKRSIKINKNISNTSTVGELSNTNSKKPIIVNPSTVDVYYEENKIDLTSYIINNHSYFRIEDLALLLDISLMFDGNNKIVGIDTNKPYDKEKHVFSSSDNVTILLYHHFINEEPLEPYYYTTVSKDKFDNDLKKLLKKGYKSLSLENYYLNKYDKNKKYFVLTFDDGYLSNYKIAFEVLKKYNVNADIFVCTDNVNLEKSFNLIQAKEMEDSGLVKIYSHYPVHIDVTKVSSTEYTSMLKKSIETLESVLNKKDFYFFAY